MDNPHTKELTAGVALHFAALVTELFRPVLDHPRFKNDGIKLGCEKQPKLTHVSWKPSRE